ncbi:hypothetical protein BYT27DRAFT_7262312 [Phlegmacium glaucopus]|nr:hypothetical protein BYT27DRAFT_7262312 [Phlegmacium glaucopus]
MYRKRRAEEEPHSPSKRPRCAYAPALTSSSPSYRPNIFTTPRTPYTPYPLRPSDSPSNPFGRKRTRRLIQSLPPSSSFSRHIALRFQFVRRAPSISPRQGGVYRIVQVPLNYTLVHLKCLIAFLFNTPSCYHRSGAINDPNDDHLFEVISKVTMYSPLYKPGQIRSGHTTVKLSNVRDPCRWRSQYGYGNDSEEDELDDSEEDREEVIEDGDGDSAEEQDDWKWEDEEDYTLGHVWPGGLDIHRGLIYHHSRSTQVHITVNNTKLPRRRGSSKTPHIFNAKGRVNLSPPPLPRPIFLKLEVAKTPSPPKRVLRSSKPMTAPTVEQELTDTDADGDTDMEADANKAFNLSHPFHQSGNQGLEHGNVLVDDSDNEGQEEDEDEQGDATLEDPNAELDPDIWNEPAHAFGIYLLKYMGHPASDIDLIMGDDEPAIDPFDDDDDDDIVPQDDESSKRHKADEEEEFDEDEEALKLELLLSSSPGLTHRYSSSSSSQAPSSPFPPTSSPFHDFLFRSSSSPPSLAGSIFPEVEAFDLEQHYPNTKYTYTPAPPKERTHRRRIERVQKRLEKMKRQRWLCARDESVSPDEEQKNEVDQLAGDDGKDDKEEKWVKPILKEGEVWDPFGDELEV